MTKSIDDLYYSLTCTNEDLKDIKARLARLDEKLYNLQERTMKIEIWQEVLTNYLVPKK